MPSNTEELVLIWRGSSTSRQDVQMELFTEMYWLAMFF